MYIEHKSNAIQFFYSTDTTAQKNTEYWKKEMNVRTEISFTYYNCNLKQIII